MMMNRGLIQSGLRLLLVVCTECILIIISKTSWWCSFGVWLVWYFVYLHVVLLRVICEVVKYTVFLSNLTQA
jgi:hypothetical protein